MFQSGIPIKFWGDCIRTVVYLINKLPSGVLQGKYPYELLFQRAPRVDHLRVFGCLCYASVLPKGDKFQEKARRTVFIGYSDTQKSYKLNELSTGIIFVSRDVTFRENTFPFKTSDDIEDVDLEDMLNITPDHLVFVVHDTVSMPQPLIIDPSDINGANLTINVDVQPEEAYSSSDQHNLTEEKVDDQ